MADEEYMRELHRRILDQDGSVVLVVGAGCSVEETNLPDAQSLSRVVHDRLILEGIIEDSACDDPSNLEKLAEAVIEAAGSTGAGKMILTERLRRHLENAAPNRGHLVAAALMMENAISSILTINFDITLTDALKNLGGLDEVGLVRGRNELRRLGRANLIYLNGTVDSPPEDWMLTTKEVESEWENHWRQALVSRVLTAPLVVFAGVGSAVGALLVTLRRIEDALDGTQILLLVDPGELEHSHFFQESQLTADSHIDQGWLNFTQSLGDRLHKKVCAELLGTANEILRENADDWPDVDLSMTCSAFERLGLVRAGKCRARWLGKDLGYEPWGNADKRQFAYLSIVVARVAEHTGTTPRITPTGGVHFDTDERGTRYSALLFHGGGTRRWAALVGKRDRLQRIMDDEPYQPTVVIGGGFTDLAPEDLAAHDIVDEPDPESVVDGADYVRFCRLEDVMANPGTVFA